MQTVPPHVRRGLLRLYLAVATPWVAWFGYQILDSLNRHPYRPWRYVSGFFWALLIVPIGGPVLFLVAIWVLAGFRKATSPTTPGFAPALQADAYRSLIAKAVSQLPVKDQAGRHEVYNRARSALANRLSKEKFRRERRALEEAITRFERTALREAAGPSTPARSAKPTNRQKSHSVLDYLVEPNKPTPGNPLHRPSTGFLIFSMLWPQYWLIDVTCMSLNWVARLTKLPESTVPSEKAALDDAIRAAQGAN
jgi:hypothetical protein